MEVLERNYQWLANKICALDRWQDAYFVFDCPGQVELFTNHTALPNVLRRLTAAREATVASDTASSATTAGTSSPLDLRLCCVHLVDSFHCADASRFISVVLLSLQTMLHLELPHVNVLSKMDLMESRGPLAFSLDFYTGVMNLDYLLEQLNGDTTGQDDEGSPSHAKARRFHKLNAALCELIDDFSLVSFHPLCIEDQRSTLGVLRAVDKANGYVFGGLDEANEAIMGVAVRGDRAVEDVTYAQERFLSRGVRERVDGDMSTLREYGCDDDECGESSVHCASVPR